METEATKSQAKRVEHQSKVGGEIAKVATQETVASAPLPVPLDASVMTAIQATVQEAMKTAVGIIVEQLKTLHFAYDPSTCYPCAQCWSA